MKYMQCTTCKKTVEANNTGTCLQCQGFLKTPQKDIWQKKQSKLSKILQIDEKENASLED